jgi:hypothetical protein
VQLDRQSPALPISLPLPLPLPVEHDPNDRAVVQRLRGDELVFTHPGSSPFDPATTAEPGSTPNRPRLELFDKAIPLTVIGV